MEKRGGRATWFVMVTIRGGGRKGRKKTTYTESKVVMYISKLMRRGRSWWCELSDNNLT